MNQADRAQLAARVMSFDYGPERPEAPARPAEVVVDAPRAPAARDPFEADFGQDPGYSYMAPVHPQPVPPPPRTAFQQHVADLHPSAPHQTITVQTPQRSILLEFGLQVLAVVAGGYVVQRFVAPRLGHHAAD